MLTKAYLGVLLLVAVPVLPQAVSPLNQAPEESQMSTPPPVSGEAYPIEVGAEENSNYVRGGMKFDTSYIDNLYPGNGQTIAETTYSILPTLALDQTTSTRHIGILYSPGFTFYEPTSALNEVDQAAVLSYHVRPSPHSVLAFNDRFQYSSTAYGSGNLGGGSVSGVTPAVAPGILAPFAKQLINSTDGEFTLQTSLSSMFGFSGTASTLHYPSLSEVNGLYDSNSRGGSAFYNRRISARQYVGTTYNYTQILSYPPSTSEIDTDVQSASAFYTIYLQRTLTLSVSGGPQRSQLEQKSVPAFTLWSPFVTASIGWQGLHTSVAASYAQALTAGGGLLGPYHSRIGNAAGRWQMSRTWTAGVSASYAINKAVSAPLLLESENGHSISGSATATHSIGRRTYFSVGYDRIHQSYAGIPAISNNPDADRVTASISWEFTRPLGR